MTIPKSSKAIFTFLAMMLLLSGCADVKRIANSLTNISKLDFSLDGVNALTIEGVDVDKIQSREDIRPLDLIKLANAYNNGRLNTSFVVNVKAENPNGTEPDQKNIPATIQNLAWDLYIDDVKTISGDLASPVKVPGGGGTEIIPLRISLDLMEYFRNQGYEKFVDLALSIGGISSDPTVVMLKAKPTVSTSFGPISYPGTIDIKHQF